MIHKYSLNHLENINSLISHWPYTSLNLNCLKGDEVRFQ